MANTKAKEPVVQAEPAVQEKIPVFIPKTDKGDTDRYICVNGHTAQVQTGKTVQMSPSMAWIVKNSLRSSEEAEKYIEDNANA